MPISASARQRVVTGLWGGRKAGSFAGRAPATTAAISGTATAAISETDIVAGGKTIIITLTNDTWVASGASFNAQRQAIINGLDSAQSEALGWNAQVRDSEVVSAVVRTSDTVVTITLSAAASYDITTAETITVTVPSTALTATIGDVTGTPVFSISEITAVVEPDAGRWVPRKRIKTIRRADFVHQEEYAAALKAAMVHIPVSQISDAPIIMSDEDEDDEIILSALARILH